MKIKIKNGKWEYNICPYEECTEVEQLIWDARYHEGILPTKKPKNKENVTFWTLVFAGIVCFLLWNFNKLMV